MRILLVEDEEHISKALVYNFNIHNYETLVVETGEEALKKAFLEKYDLIVLDVMLPGMDGFEVAKNIRKKDGRIPIIMLTAMSSDEDRIAGLECGVDDYITKPFVLKELLLRIAGLLRRAKWYTPLPEEPFVFAGNEVDPTDFSFTGSHTEKRLTQIEIDLMKYFSANPKRPVSRDELLSKVWGYTSGTETRTVDTFIMRLRKIVEPNPSKPRYLKSIRGKGYAYFPDAEK